MTQFQKVVAAEELKPGDLVTLDGQGRAIKFKEAEAVIDCNPWRPQEASVPANHQCMECKGHASIILGHSDSQVRARAIVQCAECRFWFHTDCIIRHFETDTAKKITDLESAVKARDNALESLMTRALHNEREACARIVDRLSEGSCPHLTDESCCNPALRRAAMAIRTRKT